MDTLTPREREVLAEVAKGLQNKEIARRLGNSENTVAKQIDSILRKLGVGNRTEAAVTWVTAQR